MKRHAPSASQNTEKRSKTAILVHADFIKRLSDLLRTKIAKRQSERILSRIPPIAAYYTDNIYNRPPAKGITLLETIEKTIVGFFTAQKRVRYEFQVRLHDEILRSCLPLILGNEYETLVDTVCRLRGWEGPSKYTFSVASRRSGKTFALSTILAAMLLWVPDVQIVAFAIAQRTSRELARLVKGFVDEYDEGRGASRVIVANSEILTLSGLSPSDQRTMKAFPGGGNAHTVGFFYSFFV